MSLLEENIVYENGKAWVYRDTKKRTYTVFIAGAVCSESDVSFPMTESGLSLAIARASYLARRVV